MLVHFPIVFFLSLAAFDLVAAARGVNVTGRSRAGTNSLVLVVLAAASAVATYLFGHMALGVAEAGGFSSDVAEVHEGLGTMTTAAFVVWAMVRGFWYWRDIRPGRALVAAAPVAEILGVGLVTVTAYYGGALVYGLGVNVARAAAQATGIGG